MQYLQIKYEKQNKLFKTWHLSSNEMTDKNSKVFTLGSARHADVQVDFLKGIQATLQYRNSKWIYGNMDVSSPLPAEFEINDKWELSTSEGHLKLNILNDKKKTLTRKEVEIEPGVLEQARKSPAQWKSKELFFIAGVFVFVMSFGQIMSHTKVASNPEVFLPKKETPVVVSTLAIKTQTLAKAKTANVEIDKAEKPRKPSSGGRASGGFGGEGKALPSGSGNFGPSLAFSSSGGGGKLSSLIGKVAARSGGSKNMIIAYGKKAGEGPTSRALTLGGGTSPTEGSFGPTNGQPGVSGLQVATIGRGGGSGSIASIKSIGSGKIGNGGAINLLEDETEVAGGLDKEVIAQNIKANLGQILYCYERQLSANPNLMGKVSVKFTIGGTGEVISQQVNQSTLGNSFVESCMLGKIAKWKFPVPRGGTQVNVVYPFLFKTTE